MLDNGYTREFAERTFRQLEGFGSYGFPESHAASFALIAYASSWMKCNHPDVFLAAILNAQPMGFYAPAQLVRHAARVPSFFRIGWLRQRFYVAEGLRRAQAIPNAACARRPLARVRPSGDDFEQCFEHRLRGYMASDLARRRCFFVFDHRLLPYNVLKSSGTSPNFLMTFASPKSPVAGSPVRLNATAPTCPGLRDKASARMTTATGLKHSVGSPAAMPSSAATKGSATK
jgi:hypothetical protein